MSLKTLIHNFKELPAAFFLVGYFLVLVFMLIMMLIFPRPELHLLINERHTPFLDVLMKYWTYLGDGLILTILLLGLLFLSMRHFFTGLLAFATGGLGAQLLKRLIFTDSPRPIKYFELHFPGQELQLVQGVEMHTWLSFPSGHAATAFAVFFVLALMSRSAIINILLLVMATGVAFSRVYLSQHFMMDVAAGSLFGIFMGWLAWRILRDNKSSWLNRSLPKILKA